jgi:hypothetical protein
VSYRLDITEVVLKTYVSVPSEDTVVRNLEDTMQGDKNYEHSDQDSTDL